jgi:hypothetical protein
MPVYGAALKKAGGSGSFTKADVFSYLNLIKALAGLYFRRQKQI